MQATLTLALSQTADEDSTVPVTVLKERELFGRKEYLVEPKDGTGQAWVSAARLHFQDREEE